MFEPLILTPATPQMIRIKPPTSRLYSVRISWDRPLYDPIKYEVTYSCRLEKLIVPYVTKTLPDVLFNTTSIKVPDLMPNSICHITLRGVYNPASINDPGISISVNTTAIYKRKWS